MSSRSAGRIVTPSRTVGGVVEVLAHGVGVLVAEREPEPGAGEGLVVRRHQDVLRGPALVHPAGRREGVDVAHQLGVLGGRTGGQAGGLDPDVGTPQRRRLRRADDVGDDLAVPDRHGTRGVLGLERRGDLGLGHRRVLEARRQQRRRGAVPAVPLGEQAPRGGKVLFGEGQDLGTHVHHRRSTAGVRHPIFVGDESVRRALTPRRVRVCRGMTRADGSECTSVRPLAATPRCAGPRPRSCGAAPARRRASRSAPSRRRAASGRSATRRRGGRRRPRRTPAPCS